MMQMSNTVNFKLDDDLYFKLLALRVRLKAKGGWKGFVERIIKDYGEGTIGEAKTVNKTVKEPEKPKNRNDIIAAEIERAKMLEKCTTCSHDRSEHSADGTECYGAGDACECKGFVVASA